MKYLYKVVIYRSNGEEEDYSGTLYNTYKEAEPERDEAQIYFQGYAYISNVIIDD